MKRRKLERLKAELTKLRGAPQTARALQSLARKLGRKPVKRGKEPTWESVEFKNVYPLSIPDHKGRDLAPGTKNSILNQLEGDIDAWETRIEREEQEERLKETGHAEGANGDDRGSKVDGTS